MIWSTRDGRLGALGTRARRGAIAGPAVAVAVALLAAGAGCTRDFEPFTELGKLRVLGVQAERPALAPGETATLSALVYEPDGDAIEHRWSWCPIAAGRATGFECAVTEEELALIAQSVQPGSSEQIPPFDLGGDATAELPYSMSPALLAGLCEAALEQDLPAFVPVPDCDRRLVVSVRLEVTAGGESVAAVKELPLYFEPSAATNENPDVRAMWLAPVGAGDGALVEAPQDAPLPVEAGRSYRVVVDVPLSSAQTFTPEASAGEEAPEPRREDLFATWFLTAGRTEASRTTFFDGEIGLGELVENEWRAPDRADLDGEDLAELFVVVQDERGGVAWIGRSFRVVEEGGAP